MGHENPILNALVDYQVTVEKIKTLCETGVSSFTDEFELAKEILTIIDTHRPKTS